MDLTLHLFDLKDESHRINVFEISGEQSLDKLYRKVSENFNQQLFQLNPNCFELRDNSGRLLSRDHTLIQETSLMNGDSIVIEWTPPLHVIEYGLRTQEKITWENIILKAIEKYPEAIKHIKQDRDIYIQALKINPETYQFMDPELLTQSFFFHAITNGIRILRLIKESEMNFQLFVFAINQDIFAIDDIPKHLLTDKIKHIALKNYSLTQPYYDHRLDLLTNIYMIMETFCFRIDFLPKSLIPGNFFEVISSLNFPFPRTKERKTLGKLDMAKLLMLPEHEITDEMYTEVLKSTLQIKLIPDHHLTEAMCVEGVKIDLGLHEIPDRFKTERVCLALIEARPHHFKFIPERLLTRDILFAAVRAHPDNFNEIPDHLKTHELGLLATQK